MGEQENVVVLGAGVVGLTTALVLARKNPNYQITVIAKHMPGDYDIEYASPWAGANYLPYCNPFPRFQVTHCALHCAPLQSSRGSGEDLISMTDAPQAVVGEEKSQKTQYVGKPGTPLQQFEAETGPVLFKLCREVPEAGIHFLNTVVYGRAKDAGTFTGEWMEELIKEDAWFKDIVPNFRVIPKSELKPGIDSGTSFTSVCLNTMVYLSWLVGQCVKNGVVLKRGVVKHVTDAAALHHSGNKADVIINCTGLSAGTLGGVMDPKVYPGRGQTVLVRQDVPTMATISGTDDGSDEATYIMTRAFGGGTILGGCLQKGNWNAQPDLALANRIMKRCVDLVPELTNGEGPEALDVIRHGVGLRPMREGGPRVEKERIGGIWVVHNYGHGGYGYQSSYGTAEAATRLAEECLAVKARL